MRTPVYTKQFKRDFQRAELRGKDIKKLEKAIFLLIAATPLPDKYQDHPLKGAWAGCRDLHVEPDWLLIYMVADDAVHFIRTGTHSDLFKK